MTTARTMHTAIAIGIVSVSAAAPASASTRMASSVAYAEDEMLSEAMIASPVVFDRRSLSSDSDVSRLPMSTLRMPCVTRPKRPREVSASGVAT